jgi:protein O-mannosyl-transferase
MKASRVAQAKGAKRKPAGVSPPKNLFSFISAEAQLVAIIGLVIVVFLIYANSLGNDFVFDDIYLIVENHQLKALHVPYLLSTYRPFRDLSYALDLVIWGEGPFGFHLTNILFHAANVVLVFVLIRRLTGSIVTSFVTALIFAVHPLQTDAVAYISGRRDLLFSFFYLLAAHSYLSYYRTNRSIRGAVHFVLFLLFWSFSMLSKEMAASLPILIFVWHYCEAWEPDRAWWRQVLPTAGKTLARDRWFWILLAVGGLALAFWVSRGASSRSQLGDFQYWGGSFYLNVLTVIRVHAWYLKQLVYPTPIAQYLGAFEISSTIFDWHFVVSAVVVGAVLVAGFLWLNRDKLMAFAIFSYFVLLLPVSQIIPHHELLADHYLYLPIMSFGLFVALLIAKIRARSETAGKLAYLAVGLALVVFAGMTVLQNRTWKNERTLWAANYQAVPDSPRAALNLGNTYQDTEPARAEELFKRALGLNPTPEIRRTLNDRLAVLLIQQRKFDEAEFFVAEVLSKSPHDFFGNLWSSQIHLSRKECAEARADLANADRVAKDPRETFLAGETRDQLNRDCQ